MYLYDRDSPSYFIRFGVYHANFGSRERVPESMLSENRRLSIHYLWVTFENNAIHPCPM